MIKARIHSDDFVFDYEFDAEPWFAQAKTDAIVRLAEVGWGGDYEADDVAQFIQHDTENKEIETVFEYCYNSQVPHMGFEVHIDEENALEWLKANKIEVYNEIQQAKEA